MDNTLYGKLAETELREENNKLRKLLFHLCERVSEHDYWMISEVDNLERFYIDEQERLAKQKEEIIKTALAKLSAEEREALGYAK